MKGGGRVLGFPALLLHYRQEQARRAYILGHQIRTSSTANAPSESTIPATPALGALRERLTEGGHLNPKPQDLEIENQRRSVARSLSLGPGSRFRVVDPAPSGFTHTVLKLLGYYGKQSRLIRGANTLYSRISSQVNQPELYANFALAQNFRTTHAMLVLYMWLSLCRLRSEGRDGGAMGQSLYDAFNHDLERRIIATGLKVLLSKWMKELEKNFYGAVAAYDKAMRPEAAQDELARALWRNVFAEDDAIMPTGPNSTPVHALARHIRKEAACLALTDSESFLTGNILFSSDFGTVAE